MKATIFGANGLLGSELVKTKPPEIISLSTPTSKAIDLKNKNNWRIYDNDLWINCAARVGGVKANSDFVADFYLENTEIGSNVIENAKNMQVNKLVSILSTCIYPDAKHVNYPLTEDQLHNGPPHDSNFGYAYSKRMLDVQSRAYRQQYGCNFITLIPNNLYGLNDNYDLNSGHVIPSLIRKFFEAKRDDTDVTIWGTGRPLREFTFARDAAKIIWWCSNLYSDAEPLNIGNTEEISIGDLASLIGRLIGFNKKIKFDPSKTDGQYRKPSTNFLLRKHGCDLKYTKLEEGLEESIKWFVDHYPNVRGVSR